MQPKLSNYQHIVIGSGPGGAITAFTLAESGKNVLLFEEGSNLGIDSCLQFSIEEMTTKYRNSGMTVALGKQKVSYVEARTVGGGSEVNSGLYHRTPEEVLIKWQDHWELKDSSFKELMPFFSYCEQEVNVSLSDNIPLASEMLHQGAVKLGWKSIEVPRWRKGTRRQSMSETFIPKGLNLGVELLPDHRVLKIKQDAGGKWTVFYKNRSNKVNQVTAENIHVCAGATQTPSLLLRSGIKNNIGQTLQMHPSFKFIATFDKEVNSKDMGVPVHQVKEFSPDLSFGCSISSPNYLAMGLYGDDQAIQNLESTWKKQAIYYVMISGTSQGKIKTLPFFQDPFVTYKMNSSDLQKLVDGIIHLAENLFASGAKSLSSSIGEFKSLDEMNKQDILKKMRSFGRLMTIHLFSSCPLGENTKIAAANSFGLVHGFKNLFINDGSMLCSSPGVNPQGSIMALARRNTLKLSNRL